MVSIRPACSVQVSQNDSEPLKWFTIRVRPGDTLTHLARRFGTSVKSIVALNSLRSADEIRAGAQLRVPMSGERHLRVMRGDTLGLIAWRLMVPVAQLATLNQLSAGGQLQIGQRLRLPPATGQGEEQLDPWSEDSPKLPTLVWKPLEALPPRASTGRVDGPAQPEEPSHAEKALRSFDPSRAWSDAQRLRVASAAISAAENVTKLADRFSPAVARFVGGAGAVVAGLRMVSDARTLRNDVANEGLSASSAESAAKLARNGVRVARGVELVATSLLPRLAARVVPGLTVASASLDTAAAFAIEANPKASDAERRVARAASVASWVAAFSIPVISQVAGVIATGLGLWRDAFGDERRAA